jgi:recombinational DNA repair protein RecR
MTEVQKQIHFDLRKSHVQRILEAPETYMVCTQCQSISKRTARLCPICAAYRWDHSLERIVETAKHIGRSPFPYSAGVVPRL